MANQPETSGDVPTTPSVPPLCDGTLRIVYQNNKPRGIRDSGGFLFFFKDIHKFTDQEERYREEVEHQYRLADYLLAALRSSQVTEGH